MGAIFGFLKNILQNPNKQQTVSYYDTALSPSWVQNFTLSEQTLIKIPQFVSAVDMIANDIASTIWLETKIEHSKDGIRYNEEIKDSSWYQVLNKQPNQHQSAFEFWKNNIFNLFIRGGFYFYIYKDEKGRVKELLPIHPNSIRKIKDEDGNYLYELTLYENNGFGKTTKHIPFDDIFSMYLFDLENMSDLNMRSVYASILSKLGVKEQFDLMALSQSAPIVAHVKAHQNLSQEERQEIKSSLTTFMSNAKQQGNSAVLVTDAKAEVEILNKDKTQLKSSIDPQFVVQIMTDFANAFHIPLPKLNIVSSGQSFYKSREGINIDYIAEAIQPWLEKIASKLNMLAFPKSTKKEMIYKVDKLMQVDHSTRAEYSSKMRQNAIYTTNELRALSGLKPIKGGEKLYGNGTLVELGSEQVQQPQQTSQENKNEKGGDVDEN